MNRFVLASSVLALFSVVTGCASKSGDGDLGVSGGRVGAGTDASTYADEPVAETATDPGAATPSTPPTNPGPVSDAGRPVGDGGVLGDGSVSVGADAATNALPTACKDLGHCCAQVISCDGETLA
ncbi:MAG: hypothetical protein U0235_05590 [Polyangiaceae bacterium]